MSNNNNITARGTRMGGQCNISNNNNITAQGTRVGVHCNMSNNNNITAQGTRVGVTATCQTITISLHGVHVWRSLQHVKQ